MVKKKKEHSASPKLGAQYQAAKLVVQIASPITDAAVSGERTFARVKAKVVNAAYAKGVAVALIDQYGSKMLHHSGAISNKSVTALAPELYAVEKSAVRGLDAKGKEVETANNIFTLTTTGYSPAFNDFGLGRAETRAYFALKYGLGIGRKVVNKTRIAEPVKQFLGMLGVSL